MSRGIERDGNQAKQMSGDNVQGSERRHTVNVNRIEKFSDAELSDLRDELSQTGLDSWQAAEVLSAFLIDHGYGVSQGRARDAVARMESAGCSYECMQAEIERVALVM
jgi:hypothetical protein